MRRLPIFFVLDCSESMIGENIQKMEEGIKSLVLSLRQDPHALETVYLSIIAFAGIARTITPLIDIVSFYPPKLPVGSGTCIGKALFELMKQIDISVIKNTPDIKGDWKPIIYLFTDGKATDNTNNAVVAWKQKYADKANIIAIAMGKYADISLLQQLTETVILFSDKEKGDFKKFINWITNSISSQSKSIGTAINVDRQITQFNNIISLLKRGESLHPPASDNDCIVISGRCQKNSSPYLMKYDRLKAILPFSNNIQAYHFEFSGCFQVTEEYFDWSDKDASKSSVNTNGLIGFPSCPYCANLSAFAMCGCGKIMCINGPGMACCPWCNSDVFFNNDTSGSHNFDVQRGRG